MDTRFSRSELQTKFLSEFRVSILEGRTKISCTVQMDSLGSFCLELLLFVCFICQKFKESRVMIHSYSYLVGGNGSNLAEPSTVALIQFSTRINPGRDTDHDTAGSFKCRIN